MEVTEESDPFDPDGGSGNSVNEVNELATSVTVYPNPFSGTQTLNSQPPRLEMLL